MSTGVPNDDSRIPLRIESVTKRFGEVTAVAGLSLEVAERACFGLLGPNGAGKSTLIRSIVGRVLPDSGKIWVFGEPADSFRARTSMGWAPQELSLYPLLTCRENLEAFGRYQGMRGKALREGIAWCLEWAGLAERAGSTFKVLSGGMKRRLNLAAGLIHRPRVVLLDEPTVGVDPQSRNRIFEMVLDLRNRGTTVIYTTHYMEEAERLCDRIAIMDHGHVIAEGAKEELVAQCFGGRTDVLMRFASNQPGVPEWARSLGGAMEDGIARFAIAQATDIAGLLEAASRASLELVDVSLRRPNLESVFLQLTGRGLRE
ncbi:MAG TPA: ABC transporter ATP-binding protein [Terriglobia bacterium]|nr:ABC transporter ATP-binding protein [Terriglobia bacterium]